MLNKAIENIPLPARLKSRPISARGFPVPWFITYRDAGEWDFRGVDPRRVAQAHNQKRCWICGQPRGRFLAFTIGPMCAINRISSEPPSHRECAEYAVRACPFLAHPRARRNAVDMPVGHRPAAGIGIPRNPGVAAIWITLSYRPVRAHAGEPGVLFEMGDPVATSWWSEGRPATRAEVEASVTSGLPLLEAATITQGKEAVAELGRQVIAAAPLFAAIAP